MVLTMIGVLEKSYCEIFDMLEKFLLKTYLFYTESDRFAIIASQD